LKKLLAFVSEQEGFKLKSCPCSGENEMLPICRKKEKIIETVLNNKVTIIVGDTGCGKTTMIPQFLCSPEFTEEARKKGLTKKFGVTQPRKIATTSVAGHVAKQLGCKCGAEVGYKIRWDNSTSEGTMIKFMTDGILLREMELDQNLSEYSVIMIDEAHVRNLNMDLLIGLIKLLDWREDLRVIISSATIEEEKFSSFFAGAPIIKIEGTMFPVQVVYNPTMRINTIESYDSETMTKRVIEIIKEIKVSGLKGDILVFMTGEDEIVSTVNQIRKDLPEFYCLPMYGNLSFEEQMRIFQPTRQTRIIVSTDIAETSVTVDGIVYVIDTGYVKQTNFDHKTGIGSLNVVPISQASAKQRAGRAGRTQPGVCYRLYSEESYLRFEKFTAPEIKRTNLSNVILKMKMMAINEVENFSFIDPPEKEAIRSAFENLIILGALNRNNGVTEIGKKMARMPVDPSFSRMIIAAEEYGCIDQVLTVVAAFSSRRPIFWRPRDNCEDMDRANLAHLRFKNPSSDFLTIIDVFEQFIVSSDRNFFCRINYLNSRTLWEMIQIKRQLIGILKGVRITSSTDVEKITKAIGSGLVQNICRSGIRHQYIRGGQGVFVHPSSALFGNDYINWIIAQEIRTTKRTYALNCAKIEKEWIEEIAPQLCKFDLRYVHLNKDEGIVRAIETVSYNDWEVSRKEKILTIEVAKALQEQRIAQAKKEGWIKLSFISNDLSWKCIQDPIYQLSYSSSAEDGKAYYCSVEEDSSFYFLTKRKLVKIEFEAFSFD
jgi:RNA helicase HrpA